MKVVFELDGTAGEVEEEEKEKEKEKGGWNERVEMK